MLFTIHILLFGLLYQLKVYVNGKRTEGSIKELIYLLHPNPLGMSKRFAFWPANRRGSPSRSLRGWGVR